MSRIQKRLDSVELLTPDIVINLLLSYRDIQVRPESGSKLPAFRSSSLVQPSPRPRLVLPGL